MSDTPELQLLPPIEMASIEREMRQRDSMVWSRVGLKLVAGLPLALAGPFAFALLIYIDGWISDWQWNYFTLWFVLACAIWVLLAWKFLPRVQREHYFADEVIQIVGLTPEGAPDVDLYELSGLEPRAAAQAIVTKVFAGPGRVYDAWQLVQARKAFGAPQRTRAAQILQELSRQPKGIPWLQLRREDEPLPELLTVLGYLKTADWVGFGRDGTKIWILSDARKATMAGK